MGNEPNIDIGPEDLPRVTPEPGTARRWSPRRPGDFDSPAEVPWGGRFGTPGPDTGFAYRIVRALDLPGGEHHRRDVEAVLVAVMAARASAIGRAPTASDASAAIDLLSLTEANAESFSGIAHDHVRLADAVEAIPVGRLTE